MNTTKTAKLVIAVIVLGTATTYLLLQAVKSSWAYYYSVDKFVESNLYTQLQESHKASDSATNNRMIRLAGWVKEGSIERNQETATLDFELTGKKNSVSVTYTGPVPKNFEAGREVVVEGKLSSNQIFKADKIMTRCESKYKVKL